MCARLMSICLDHPNPFWTIGLRIASSPFARSGLILGLVGHVLICDCGNQWVLGIRVRQQRADGQEYLANRQRGRPLVLENIKTNTARLVDVGVVDLGDECNLWGFEWVIHGELNPEGKQPTLEWTICRTHDGPVPCVNVLLILRTRTAVAGRVSLEILEFPDDTLG